MATFNGNRVTQRGGADAGRGDNPHYLGSAMAEGLQTLVHASTYPKRLEEDSDGLISSDHIVQAMGRALEAGGAKRL
jgi:hypothetical protein